MLKYTLVTQIMIKALKQVLKQVTRKQSI